MQDWGGPIGISYAVTRPENVKRLVIMNTWMWGVQDDAGARRFSKFLGGRLGHFLIMRFNFFVNVIMKSATVNKERLAKPIHRHYRKPQENPKDRTGSWVFPREILGSTEWLKGLWERREKIADKKALIIWAMKDIAFKEPALRKWQRLMKNAKTLKLDNSGHYLQEEMRDELCGPIEKFMEGG
jgi:haloalkane dehalogenase